MSDGARRGGPRQASNMARKKVDLPLLFKLWHSPVTNAEICKRMGFSDKFLARLAKHHHLPPRRGLFERDIIIKPIPSAAERARRAADIRQKWSVEERLRRRSLLCPDTAKRFYDYDGNLLDGEH